MTITNGPVGGHIYVTGADAVGSDGLNPAWTLCRDLPPATCTGSNVGTTTAPDFAPGQDQYFEFSAAPVTGGGYYPGFGLSNAPQCDDVFDEPTAFNCASSPGATVTEEIGLRGPSTTTDQSPTFTTTVTWMAVP